MSEPNYRALYFDLCRSYISLEKELRELDDHVRALKNKYYKSFPDAWEAVNNKNE